ncbi:putative Ig domain-containing protein, partial [Rhodococcus marinonascens]|uniref:putative Ig domain-containing protein n=1 Tax=Rhodococcus marinonascens TaxID=38311 RepID=UPI000B1C2426
DGTRAYVTNNGDKTVSVIAIEWAPTLTVTLPAGAVGQPYEYTFTVAGQPIPTTVTAGTLPDGLTLDADGVLSGTPTATGQFAFTVTATNGIGDDAVLPVVLDINEAPSTGSLGSLESWGS